MSSRPLPQRQSLVAQTVAFITARIEAGEWREWLPSERALCEQLQVSRNTVRAALLQLNRQRRVESQHGEGTRILSRPERRASTQARDVALLTPLPIERLRPMQSLWIDEMRALLGERDIKLRVFHGPQYFGSKPGPALQRLVSRNPHGCWMLMLAADPVQRWFAKRGVPSIVAGSTFPAVNLPFRDLDHRATCRHAAGVLLGLGHRHVALLVAKSRHAGDLESEAGFQDAVRQSRHADAVGMVVTHDGTPTSITQALQRVRRMRPSPTALLVTHPHAYLAVASRLAQLGVRVPEDVSLVSRDDDPFLEFIVPAPARYRVSAHRLARALLPPVLELLAGQSVAQRGAYLMPEFERGESVGPAVSAEVKGEKRTEQDDEHGTRHRP